jgi:hypothetical protein
MALNNVDDLWDCLHKNIDNSMLVKRTPKGKGKAATRQNTVWPRRNKDGTTCLVPLFHSLVVLGGLDLASIFSFTHKRSFFRSRHWHSKHTYPLCLLKSAKRRGCKRLDTPPWCVHGFPNAIAVQKISLVVQKRKVVSQTGDYLGADESGRYKEETLANGYSTDELVFSNTARGAAFVNFQHT